MVVILKSRSGRSEMQKQHKMKVSELRRTRMKAAQKEHIIVIAAKAVVRVTQ